MHSLLETRLPLISGTKALFKINEGPLYIVFLQWTPSNPATCQSVLNTGVASFQGSRLEGS